MKDNNLGMSPRGSALVAGLALLGMTILAIFANFVVLSNLVVPEDAAMTASNIAANELQFRAAICSFVIVAVLDVVVAWALYGFLRQVDKGLSLLAAWFRLVYATILGVALANLVGVLLLLSGANGLAVLGAGHLQAQVAILVGAFNYSWDIGCVFFGLHLLVLGYLVFKLTYPGYIPRILGVLLVIASFGYLVDSFASFLVPKYNVSIAMFTFVGELLLMLWLLWKGARGFDMKMEE